MSQDSWIQNTRRKKGAKWQERGLDYYWKLISSGKITSISASQEDSSSLQYACECECLENFSLCLRTAMTTIRSMVLLEGLLEVLPWVMETKQLLKGKMTQHQWTTHTCYINNVKNTYVGNNMKAVQGSLMLRNVIFSVPSPNQPSNRQARNIFDYVYACSWWKIWEKQAFWKTNPVPLQNTWDFFPLFFQQWNCLVTLIY